LGQSPGWKRLSKRKRIWVRILSARQLGAEGVQGEGCGVQFSPPKGKKKNVKKPGKKGGGPWLKGREIIVPKKKSRFNGRGIHKLKVQDRIMGGG